MHSVVERRRRKSGRPYFVVYCGAKVVLMTYNRTEAYSYLALNQSATSAA